jgi:NADPH:quinone reductase
VTINSSEEDVVGAVLAATANRGADVVIDTIGASALEENLRLTGMGGRIVHVGRLGDALATIDLRELARKRVHLIGSSWSTRPYTDRVSVVSRCARYTAGQIWALRPRISATFALEDEETALSELARNEHVGKLVLLSDSKESSRRPGLSDLRK